MENQRGEITSLWSYTKSELQQSPGLFSDKPLLVSYLTCFQIPLTQARSGKHLCRDMSFQRAVVLHLADFSKVE